MLEYKKLNLAHEEYDDSGPLIIPYKVVNIRLIALYGIISKGRYSLTICARGERVT